MRPPSACRLYWSIRDEVVCDAPLTTPQCPGCGAQRTTKMSDSGHVVLWYCSACGNIWGTRRNNSPRDIAEEK